MRPYLVLKTWSKQLSGSLPLDIMLPGLRLANKPFPLLSEFCSYKNSFNIIELFYFITDNENKYVSVYFFSILKFYIYCEVSIKL
jgi:hypothetical protein